MNKILNTFKLTTGLEITYFNSANTITNHIKSSYMITKDLSNKKIYGDIINLTCLSKGYHIAHISLESNLIISVIYLNSYKNTTGYFLIGPYCTKKSTASNSSIPYKNMICIKYYSQILLNIIEDLYNPEESAKNNVISFHIKKSIEYIHNNYEKQITTEMMSNILNINKCYLCNTFKKETGLTFTNFLCKFRVKKSLELLRDTSLSLLDVAISVGFSNQSYYTMAFKKIYNMTPLEYRKSKVEALVDNSSTGII